ncbi:putative histidinol-phosphate transaminase [Helianthus annuus]|nr:putative histidinol-phosphate transaminase [Helianthus annuus]KAJ0574905.1 putative histidinol-phosphate transaminase [Helianthus annuus]KAJ0739235.1 putative histidinol-phosphate transaminase [Helianthus annuus]KAJ0742087.1 putative histidinol-phosphate transaminase [Helianthus annuus]KAJ0913516.1 putative histidinol-phosphate transaminase [Helianthus annuus]
MDFSLDVQKITEVIEREKPKIIFLTSPNNPDGSVINDDVLLKILDLPNLVVLDEAYIEFSGLESKMGWVKKHENLIVLRTFSKRAGRRYKCSCHQGGERTGCSHFMSQPE